jgi:uncharacterized repeat protein (TIGR01451 family)
MDAEARKLDGTRGVGRRLGLALLLLAAAGLVVASSAASYPAREAGSALAAAGPPANQGDPDKVITVSSGYQCGGALMEGPKISGGLGETISFSASLPIVQVTVKSGQGAELLSSSFASSYLTGSITLNKDVSSYIVWTCATPAKATLTVIKQVINNNGGSKSASDFTIQVSGSNANPASFAGSASGTAVSLDAGAYSVTETPPAGYSVSYSSGCSGTLAAGGSATCTVTNNDNPPGTNDPGPPGSTPTPPNVSATPAVDLSIVKTDAPDPALVGGRIEYTLAVTNKGAAQATGVVVTDDLPDEVEFVSVSTSQGTCTGGPVVTCDLGTLAVGASATVRIVVRPLSPGLILNTGTVRGTETDANPADNTSTAPTLVEGPFAPPAARCPQLIVGQRTLTVGKRATIVARVRLDRLGLRGMRITVRGAGVRVNGRTGAAGLARIAVRPSRTGIIVIRMAGQPARCGSRRIGVVGIFRPPSLTG